MTIPGTVDPWWETTALAAIETLARTGHPFTTSDLTELGVVDPDHPCRWGSIIAKAKTLGIIQRVGYGTSRRAGRNAGYCSIWTGTNT